MPAVTSPLSPLELLLKYDKPVPRYTSYPTAASFTSAVGEEQLRRQLTEPSTEALSLYVHVPFCRHACWYCGCNRITTQLGSKVVTPYLETLGHELSLVADLLQHSRPLQQIHLGGGTPNYLNASEMEHLWRLIEKHFPLASGLDASIELNPEFVTAQSARQLRSLGFNRASFGIQDADPVVQQAVNRVVPADQLRKVMADLRDAGFKSVNVDLICGLPLQTPDRFAKTIALVQELRPDRISLFSFAYLPEQLPMQKKIRALDLPSPQQRIAMLEQAHDDLIASGYCAIGMDHYALVDDPLALAASEGSLHRNFQGYTTGGAMDLLGVGPTAISQFPHLLCQNQRDFKSWRAAIQAGSLSVERGIEVFDQDTLERRDLIRQLMCQFVVAFDRSRFSCEWIDFKALAADGLVTLSEQSNQGQVTVTEVGRLLIRTIASVFDPDQRRQARGSSLI